LGFVAGGVFETFMAELAERVEMGQSATDSDYVTFQCSVSANVKGGVKARQEILLRKLFRITPELADVFDPSVIVESGVASRIAELGASVSAFVGQINGKYAATNGEDVFKATNKTAQAFLRTHKPAKDRRRLQEFHR
jgi:hypothetical protein